ncbi:MAG: heavy metal translocating P-type ATPase metal-binding domain-containing protein [Saprospiraceae bacterium]|jgi:Cu+-exporting ATPase|nr:heavy metal translocating P-type ATPase metal-binding domain-containing protein [Saprospiraceae bacterium]
MPVASQDKTTLRVAPQHDNCYHCGSECAEETIRFDDKPFCCEGCRMVYDILNSNGLCKYYDLDENAGISLKGKSKGEYAYLDDPEVKGHLVQFSDGAHTNVTFYTPSMHCNSCIWLLENLYRLSDGITASKVHFPKKEVFISFDEKVTSLRKVVELLASLGYEPAINYSNLNADKHPIVNRTFYYQLGVAGFAFGNIMLLSFPEYLGLETLAEASFARLFGYLNIILATPVLLYSGKDYLLSAWRGIRHRELNMDIPISLGIITFYIRSAYEIISGAGAGFMDSLAGLVFFLLIGKWFQQRTYYHISFERDYRSYFPIAALLKKGNSTTSVSLDRLKAGDQIIVRNQEIIPADATLLDGEAQIDYSFVTGESEPVSIAKGEKVFAGGRQTGSAIELMVNRKVSQSYLTQLWNNEAFNKPQYLAASRLADRVGKYFTFAILLVGFGTLAYWLPRDSTIAINAFTAVLIIACPCAVALAIPFIFGNVLRILGRHEFYLRNTIVIESIEAVDAVVVDKTGTLTSRKSTGMAFHGELNETEARMVAALAKPSGHPLSVAVYQYLQRQYQWLPDELPQPDQWQEIPGQGVEASFGKQHLQLGSAAWLTGNTTDQKGNTYLAIDGKVKGYFEAQSSMRGGLTKVLDHLGKLGPIYLLSGDNEREKDDFERLLPRGSQLFFRQSPFDKLDKVNQLQAEGRTILMLGDGLNDAGALKQSNAGIVITEESNNFTPACDAILRAESFHLLPQMLRLAKRSVYLVYGAYGLALVYNVVGLSYAVQGVFTPLVAAILMPLSSITIVIYGFLSSNLVAKRLGL